MSLDVSFDGVNGRSDHNWTDAVVETLLEAESLLGNVQAILKLSDKPQTPGRWLSAISYEVSRLSGDYHRDVRLADVDGEDTDSTEYDNYAADMAVVAELSRVVNLLVNQHQVFPVPLTRRVEIYCLWSDHHWDLRHVEVPLMPEDEVNDEVVQIAVQGLRAANADVEAAGLHFVTDGEAQL